MSDLNITPSQVKPASSNRARAQIAIAGETIDAGMPVYVHTDGKYYKALNDTSAHANAFGMAACSATTGQYMCAWATGVQLTIGVVNEEQTLTLSGGATGNFTLTYSGQTTGNIDVGASAATVQSALEALSNIAVGDVSVTGSNGGPWTVEFTGTLGGQNVAQMTKTDPDGSGTLTIATSVPGSAGDLTAGDVYNVSVNAGGIAPVADTLTGAYVTRLARAVSATDAIIDISASGITHG